jgi:hypothetical protein
MPLCEVALWLTEYSSWPEIDESFQVDPWALPFETVQAFMRERKEGYAFKAAVRMGQGSIRRYHRVHVSSGGSGALPEPVFASEVVQQLLPVLAEDGIDPVEVCSQEAFELVRSVAACEPDGVCARWYALALAADVRAFREVWNATASAEVRQRLLLEMAEEMGKR